MSAYVASGSFKKPLTYVLGYTSTYKTDDGKFNYDYMDTNMYSTSYEDAAFSWNIDDDEDDKDLWVAVWGDDDDSDQADKIDYPAADFTKKMECGQCIKQGNWFCIKTSGKFDQYGSVYEGVDNEQLGVCCHDQYNCPVLDDGDWECSN